MENLGLHHYKARAYHSGVGRFLQTDPIGYGDGMNMYAYVGNDPVNFIDPGGMQRWCISVTSDDGDIGHHCGVTYITNPGGGGGGHGAPSSGGERNWRDEEGNEDVVEMMQEKEHHIDDRIVVEGQKPTWRSGLISTRGFSCDGVCLPTIDYYFTEFGPVIVAQRKKEYTFHLSSYGVGLYALNSQRQAQMELSCRLAAAATGFAGINGLAHRRSPTRMRLAAG